MSERSRRASWPRITHLIVLTCLLGSCAHRTPTGPDARPAPTTRAERQADALIALDAATTALRRGQTATAERELRHAVTVLGTPPAAGEWTALVGRESSKAWRGEPYERMAAHLTLGWMLYATGDHDNAIAMSKSALLSDTGTATELWRSDLVTGWVLQGLALQADGEVSNGDASLTRAADALYARDTLDRMDTALHSTRPARGTDPVGDEKARLALFAALPAGVWSSPRDADRAAEATRSRAMELMQMARHQSKTTRRMGLHRFSQSDFDAAAQAIGPLVERWRATLRTTPPTSPVAESARRIESLMGEPPPVVVLVQHGRGPRKDAEGDYDERLVIRPGVQTPAPPVTLDGRRATSTLLDSTTFQATTRGGRRVDAWLRGKAIYRDTGLVSGFFLLFLSQELAYRGDREAATFVAIAGAGLAATAAVTLPQADTRGWDGVPESWSLATFDAQPGTHTLAVGDRRIQVQVAERGQTVIFAPLEGPLVTGPTGR